jgi:excisionase family DNA binding protein
VTGELPQVLGPAQVAEWLEMSESGVRRLAAQGVIPGRKIGKLWRFNRDALAEWMRGAA